MKLKFFLQKLAIKFYEKMQCRDLDTENFWKYHIMFAVGKKNNSKIIVAELERIQEHPMKEKGYFVDNNFYPTTTTHELLPFCTSCFGTGFDYGLESNFCHQCGSNNSCIPVPKEDIKYLQERISSCIKEAQTKRIITKQDNSDTIVH